mgnify:CR=1 FL=1
MSASPSTNAPDLRGAHVAGQVDAHAPASRAGAKYWRKVRQSGVIFRCSYSGFVGGDDRIVLRSNRAAFAGDFGRDALVDFRRQAWIDENG